MLFCYTKIVMKLMKLIFTNFLIFGLVGIVFFSLIIMDHKNIFSHNSCILATTQNADCPKEINTLSFITFHLNAFKSFSTAIISDSFASALFLLLILTIGFVAIAIIQPTLSTLVAANYFRRKFLESYSFPFQRELTHWLALHENIPVIL